MGNTALKLVLGAAAVCVTATGYSAPTFAADPYFKGKTITLLIGRGAGSGADATVRSFAKYWAKHIPGNPKIVPKNMGRNKEWNFTYEKAKPNGLTMAFSPYDPVSQMIKKKGFRADYTKLIFVGSFLNPSMLYASTGVVKNRDDIMNMKGGIYGGQKPTIRFDLFGRMTLNMMGADYKYTTGFGGAKKVLNAMRRDEVQIQTIGLNLFRLSAEKALVTPGKATTLWYYSWPGYEKTASTIMGGVPRFQDHYKKIKGKFPSGPMYETYEWMSTTLNGMSYTSMLPPGTPQNVVDILRKSFGTAAKDSGYLAEQKKMFSFHLPYVDPATGAKIIGAMKNAPAKHVAFLKDFIAEGTKFSRKKKKK